jgi:hypothetical protein
VEYEPSRPEARESDLAIWLFRGATILAAASFLLALASLVLVVTNQHLLNQTDEQRQFVQQTAQLSGVNETLVRLIARAALDEKDLKLRDLLVSHGFRLEGEGPPALAAPPPSAERPK